MNSFAAALVISNRTLWEQTHACIQNLPVRIALEQTEPEDTEGLLDRIERHRADVVLLEASRLSQPLDEFARRLGETASQPALFVLHAEAAPQQILEALRAGAREFLYPPLSESLRDAFERLSVTRAQSPSTQSSLGKLFGFMSASGGCGATTFASHTAAAVCRDRKEPALLADLDFDAGLLRFIFKARTAYSVREALDNMHRMDGSYWKALVGTHANQLDLICAPEDLAARTPVGPNEVAHLLRFVRSMYRTSIVDFGRWYSPAAEESIPEVETLFVVTTLELMALDQAKECLRILSERGAPLNRVKVLLNRVPAKGTPDLKSISSYLETELAGVFSDDPEPLYDAWSEGRLVGSDSRFGKEINKFASVLGKDLSADAPATAAVSSSAGVKRWFSFLQKAQA